ncbi:MAG: hypothetical protein WCX93_06865 [Burkholderiaceae bacterium]
MDSEEKTGVGAGINLKKILESIWKPSSAKGSADYPPQAVDNFGENLGIYPSTVFFFSQAW